MKKIALLILVFGFLFSCSKDDSKTERLKYAPGEVLVGVKSGTDIEDLFDFINLFDHEVDILSYLTFSSDLPLDSLQYTLDKLNEKVYTNDGQYWFVTASLDDQTNQFTISTRLFSVHNLAYQMDWLDAMTEFKLNEKQNSNTIMVHFHVPVGEEIEWRDQFAGYDIVEWAELNRIVYAQPFMN